MKTILSLLFATLVLGSPMPSLANVIINPGYMVQGELQGFVRTGTTVDNDRTTFGFIGIHFNNIFTSADSVKTDFFTTGDYGVASSPYISNTWVGFYDEYVIAGTNYGFGGPGLNDVWVNLHGSYQITAISGMVDLNFMNFRIYNDLQEYTLTIDSFPEPVPAPEPASLSLLALGSLLLLHRRK